jgi:hypothetical protein
MSIDRQVALSQIDDVLREFREVRKSIDNWMDDGEVRERTIIARMRSVITRLAPPGSSHRSILRGMWGNYDDEMLDLAGVVGALRADYEGDCLQSFQELLNVQLCSDYLRLAESLLQDEQLKQPAAVLAGGVLEEHLRKLCIKHEIPTDANGDPKQASRLNADLRKADCYGLNEQKQIEAWLGIRNSAAHAKYHEFDEDQVRNMIQGLRDFTSRYSA